MVRRLIGSADLEYMVIENPITVEVIGRMRWEADEVFTGVDGDGDFSFVADLVRDGVSSAFKGSEMIKAILFHDVQGSLFDV